MEMDRKEGVPSELSLATFSDRVAAFSLDILVAVGGYFLTLKLAFPSYEVLLNPYSGRWLALWTVLFLVYQALLSSEGRVSLGKKALGIRVVSGDGEPLTLPQAAMRSVSYLVSSVLNLGFLWSLFNPSRQCWHDMVIGSVVIEDRPKSPARRLVVRAAAAGCMALIAGLWYWNNVAAPRYYRIMDIAYAKVGLNEIATLQRIHRLKHGKYADNLLALAPLSGQPLVFMNDMTKLFDVKSGFSMRSGPASFTITARAMDQGRTLVTYTGS